MKRRGINAQISRALSGILFFLFIGSAHAFYAAIIYPNETVASVIHYDRGENASFSYADNTPANPDLFLKICNISSDFLGKKIELLYSSESGNITIPILSLPPEIYAINFTNSTNCSIIDIDISAFEALYPAIPFVRINISENTSLIKKLSQSFNGSYILGVGLDDVEKRIYLSVQKILDDKGMEINNATKNNLIISIVSKNVSVREARTSPKSVVSFAYTFSTGDEVFVNGISSLKVKVIEPCSVINETGYYYILNDSAWNSKEACLVIRNVSNIVVDFGNHTIDGDGNKSYEEGKCGIIIDSVENVTVKDLRAQEYRYGVCIFNSKNVRILGTSDQENIHGILIDNAFAEIARVKMKNKESEIVSRNNGIAELKVVYFATANFSARAKDVVIKNVFNPPPDPEALQNISQWINVSKNGDSWLYFPGFTFPWPPPGNIIPEYIAKYRGSFVNGTWNGSWELLENTRLDLIKNFVYAEINISDFSIFAPFGKKTLEKPKPVPQPTPVPRPRPSAAPGEAEKAVPPRLNLTLHEYEVVIQQGETRAIGFNLTNEGEIDVYGAVVLAQIRKGWKTAPVYFDLIKKGETKISKFYITVYENEIPGTYYIPVKAMLRKNNVTVDVEILKVIVIPRKRVAKIDILEVLPYLVLPENSKQGISVLVENTGDFDLHDLTLTIEGAEDCIKKIEGNYELKKGEKKALTFFVYTKKAGKKCYGAYVFKAKEGVVGIYPVIIKIRPKSLVERIKIFVIIYIVWTLATLYVIYRKVKT